MPDSPEAIRLEREGPVVTVTLCRPERRNALDGSVVAALRDAVRPLAEDPDLRVVVFRLGGPRAAPWAATEPSVLDAVAAFGQARDEPRGR